MRPAQTGESCVDYGQGEVVKRQLQVFHLTKRMTGTKERSGPWVALGNASVPAVPLRTIFHHHRY
jgi:hypothetical protein